MKMQYKVLSAAALTAAVVATAVTPVDAAVVGRVVQSGGENFVYDDMDLALSFLYFKNNPESSGAALYSDFFEKASLGGTTALVDDKNGFIDFNATLLQYLQNPGSFKLNEFTESDTAPSKELSNVKIVVIEDGEVVAKPVDPVEELVVENVVVIDATTLSVTFEGMEAVEVTVDALVHGQLEVTFEYEGETYTFELDTPWVDPAVVAIEAAIAEAEAAIEDLPTVEELVLGDAGAVANARALVVAALELDADAEIEGLDKLVALEAQLVVLEEEKDAAEELANAIALAEAAIADLPAEITLADKEAVDAAVALVEAVHNLDEEAEINGIEILDAAVATIAQLEQEAAEQAIINAAVAAVNTQTTNVGTRDALIANAGVLGLDLTDFNKFNATTKLDVATAVRAAKPAEDGFANADAIKDAFEAAVFGVVLGKLNGVGPIVPADPADPEADLEAYEAAVEAYQAFLMKYAVTLKLNLDAYNELTVIGDDLVDTKFEVIAAVYNEGVPYELTEAIEDAPAVTELEKIQTAFGDAVKLWTAVLAINAATETNIEAVLLANAEALGIDEDDVAAFEELNVDRKALVVYTLLDGAPYTSAGDIVTAFEGVLSTQLTDEIEDAIDEVNDVTRENLLSVLKKRAVILELDLEELEALDADDLVIALDAIFADVSEDGVEDGEELQDVIDAAVANVVILAINAAITDEDADAVLEALKKYARSLQLKITHSYDEEGDLDERSDFAMLLDQLAVAELVLENGPYEGETAAADIKVEFNAAVATQKVVESVDAMNAANDFESVIAVLTNDFYAEGLELDGTASTTFGTLTPNGKNVVAEAILDLKGEKFEDIEDGATAAEQIAAEFLRVVNLQAGNEVNLAITAVNSAITRTQMRNALNNHKEAIAITLDNFNKLGLTAQNGVLDTLIANTYASNEIAVLKADFLELVAVQAVYGATTKEAMLEVLVANAVGLDIDIETEVESGLSANFADLSPERQLLVAKFVLDAKQAVIDDEDKELSSHFTQGHIEAAFDAGVDAQLLEVRGTEALALVNAFEVEEGDDEVEEILALLLENAEYLGLEIGDGEDFEQDFDDHKEAIAAVVLAGVGSFETVADLQTLVYTQLAIEVINAVDAGAAAMETALEKYADILGIDVDEDSVYDELRNVSNAVGQLVLDIREDQDDEFANKDAIKQAFLDALAIQLVVEAVEDVNETENATEMQVELVGNAALLGLEVGEGSTYASFASAGKLRVAQSVYAAKVAAGGFEADVEDDEVTVTAVEKIQKAFNDAVALEQAMVEVRAAVTADNAEMMQTALVNNSKILNLNIGVEEDEEEEIEATRYFTLDDTAKLEVAKAVLKAAPFANSTQVRTAFNSALNLQLSIDALNVALEKGTNAQVVTALENVTGVTLTGFNALSDQPKAFVIADLRDANTFYTVKAINDALKAAVDTYKTIDELFDNAKTKVEELETAVDTLDLTDADDLAEAEAAVAEAEAALAAMADGDDRKDDLVTEFNGYKTTVEQARLDFDNADALETAETEVSALEDAVALIDLDEEATIEAAEAAVTAAETALGEVADEVTGKSDLVDAFEAAKEVVEQARLDFNNADALEEAETKVSDLEDAVALIDLDEEATIEAAEAAVTAAETALGEVADGVTGKSDLVDAFEAAKAVVEQARLDFNETP